MKLTSVRQRRRTCRREFRRIRW